MGGGDWEREEGEIVKIVKIVKMVKLYTKDSKTNSNK